MHVTTEKRQPRLRCLRCSGNLEVGEQRCACPACGAEWPVTGGIPRFNAAEYWGELPLNDARKLVEDARARSWREAVQDRFPQGDMNISIMDPQRAAWLPLLGLDRNAVALDIGSGLGAITHSLARSLGEVYSVEAVPERIEFTQVRLRQEGLDNVHLIQTSASALPFCEESFDLIVINGILEWVGEWDLEGSPRDVQLRFLRAAQKLLKPEGVAMIGIENRFGYGLFLGGMDHSGLPYTSLMPRRAATFVLQRSARQHHRTQLNAKREYRTYTYSLGGYRKLLAEAGFADRTFYWAEPGYNQPYNLIPLSVPAVAKEHLRGMFDHVGTRRPKLAKRMLRKLMLHLPGFAWLAPDFVILAGREGYRGGQLAAWLRENVNATLPRADRLELASHTTAFSSKQVLRITRPAAAVGRGLVKAEVRTDEPLARPSLEFDNLRQLSEQLRREPQAAFGVPQPIQSLRLGNTFYTLESVARGKQFSRDAWSPGYYKDMARVQRDFARLTRASVALTRYLGGFREADPIDRSWHELSAGSERCRRAAVEIASLRYSGLKTDASGWVQHGDLTVENMFLDPATDTVEIIDWTSLAVGFPPLYDLFSLFLSCGYLDPARGQAGFGSEADFWKASFSDLFLSSRNPMATLIAGLLTDACREHEIESRLLPGLLLEFLIVRTNAYRGRGSSRAERIHRDLLDTLLEDPARQVLGISPLGTVRSATAS